MLRKIRKIEKKMLTRSDAYNIISQFDEVRKYLTIAPVRVFSMIDPIVYFRYYRREIHEQLYG